MKSFKRILSLLCLSTVLNTSKTNAGFTSFAAVVSMIQGAIGMSGGVLCGLNGLKILSGLDDLSSYGIEKGSKENTCCGLVFEAISALVFGISYCIYHTGKVAKNSASTTDEKQESTAEKKPVSTVANG
jgi:hypothetical protein